MSDWLTGMALAPGGSALNVSPGWLKREFCSGEISRVQVSSRIKGSW